MLSTRGSTWAKVDFAHGEQDVYNSSTNPNGIVSFANAENVTDVISFEIEEIADNQ